MDGSQNGYNLYMYNLSYSIHSTDFFLKRIPSVTANFKADSSVADHPSANWIIFPSSEKVLELSLPLAIFSDGIDFLPNVKTGETFY
ncbi:hypothetical protein P5673_000111 [Acropora cervicornis]|uniref:Uncharacterized protein n=1 Tax=Acropora cervicornis TaxID=6130 RepID=A0AAD9R6D9_ACRCE|nr:hypothetical protein P5673_000111 [Acropora cervicornis]